LQKEQETGGRFSISLKYDDYDIIYKISKFVPCNYTISCRERITNFTPKSKTSKSIGIRINNQCFREFLNENGVPHGNKTNNISPPLHSKNLSIIDYIRGLYDGDGSVGLTKTNRVVPYMSLTTSSDNVAYFIFDFISNLCGKPKKKTNRNKRDNVYNIVVFKEDAIKLANLLYYKDCLSIKRKYEKAQTIKMWANNKLS